MRRTAPPLLFQYNYYDDDVIHSSAYSSSSSSPSSLANKSRKSWPRAVANYNVCDFSPP